MPRKIYKSIPRVDSRGKEIEGAEPFNFYREIVKTPAPKARRQYRRAMKTSGKLGTIYESVRGDLPANLVYGAFWRCHDQSVKAQKRIRYVAGVERRRKAS